MSLLNTKDLSNLTGAKQLVDTLVASGITTSNITFKGVNGAVGTFTGGIGAGIGIESGIVLSTGQISFAASTNTNDSFGKNNQQLGDTDLNKIVGSLGTFDAAVLEFDFIPQSSEVSFSYVFASEEYPEWVGTAFNDVFAFYLNGQNIALVPGTTTPVAINTINGGNPAGNPDYGVPASYPATNSSFFVPNYFGNAPKDIQFDGFTTVLSATATGLVPGVASRVKLAIADTADNFLDSAVFVQASSFGNATLVTVVATDDYAKEGTTPDQGVFTITRTGSTAAPLTVSYSLSGSASSADYNTILSTVTIPAGSASTTVTVTPVDDTLTEGNETVILSLIDTNSYDLGRQNSGTVIIRDNESENIVVSLSVAPASVVEDGTGNLVYTFTRASGTTTPIDLTSPLTVNYNVGGSATLNSDYTQTGAASFTSTTGKITFAAGSATATLTIDPTVDTTIESNETVALTLASGSGYSVDTATAVIGTIVDDDTPVISLSLNPTSVSEDGTSNLVYTFTRTGSTISGLTVNYGVSGTATLGTDYVATGAASFTATTGTITFAAGSSTATLTIDPTADTTVESDETVALTIAPATGYTVGTNTAVTGTILNDDTIVTTVTLAVNTTSVAENGTTNPVYTFTRTGVTTNALTVNYSVAGTADSTDYTGTTPGTGKTITFAAGATTATVTIDPTADIALESDETVALTLASGTGYTVGTTTAVTTTIVNDDTRVTLGLAPTSVAEDGTTNPVYTFTRTGVTTNALTVNYSVAGTADSTDYTGTTPGTGKTITFAAGATTATVTIDPTADIALESDETVALTLASGTGYTVGTTTAVTTTIVNDDTRVTLALAPTRVDEDGTTNLVYTFTRTGVTSNALTVNYNVGGTATFSTDYTQIGAGSFTATTGTVTFAAGATTATLTIDPKADTALESDETVALTLAPGTGYTAATTTEVTGTIVNAIPCGHGWGDVHMLTFDQRAYDFQAVGEFIFVESPNGDFQLQTRQKPWVNNRNVSVNRAFATKLGGSNVVFDAELAVGQELKIGGVTTTLTSGQSLSVGNSRIQRQGNQYTLIYAGPDGVISTSDDDEVTLRDFDSYLNITVCPANYRGSQIQGLLGNADGVTANDFALRDGTSLGANPTWQTIHTTYADSWRITQGESLFVTTTFADKTLPEREASLGTLPRDQVNAAVIVGFNAGLAPGPILDGAALDAAATGDNRFITDAATTFADVIVRPDQRGSLITLDIAPNSVNEDGTQNLVYTFTRTGNTTNAVTVNYNVGGTATVGTDYTQTGAASFTGTTGTITFAPGATTATVTIDPTVDTTVERNETVDLTLVPGTGYIPGTTTAVTGTIVNAIACGHGWGDVHMITFDQRYYDFQAVGEFIFVESPNGDFQLQTRQKPWVNNRNVSVNRAFATKLGGSNVVFDAELAVGQELKIGGVTTTLTSGQSLSVGNSRIQRQGNQYTLIYAGPDGVISTSDDDEVTLRDFDSYLNITVCPANYRGSQIQGLLGNADGVTANDFALRDGTSLGANPTWQTIHTTYADSWRITQGESLFVTTTFADKTLPEREASLGTLPRDQVNAAVIVGFNAGLAPGPILDGAALDAAATGDNRFITDAATTFADVIVRPDQRGSLITLDIAPNSVNEDGTQNLVYTFTRTGNSTDAVTVNYNVGGTATFSTDYTQIGAASFTGTTGTITFAPGATTATVTIDPTADIALESDETVALTLASGTGYTVGTTTAVTTTIVNDDTRVTLALAPTRVDEDGTTNLVYTFTRTGVTSNALTVNYNVGGTATFSTDYTQIGAASFTGTTGTITFAPGATTATVTIDPTVDTTVERNETVDLTLVPGTGYIPETTTAVTGTIVNAIATGHGWGDVHMLTFDQRHYDFQAVGEFIFVESPNSDFQLQTRQKPYGTSTRVSVNTAFATKLGGSSIVYDTQLATGQELKIGGVTTTLRSGQSLSVGNGRIQRQGTKYTLTYAGPDGVISTSDDDVVNVNDRGVFLNIDVSPADYRGSNIQGLLGNADGVTSNDFTLRDGTSLGANPSRQTIHTTYADSWRITQSESLFGTTTFADKTFPQQFVTLANLPVATANAAVKAAFNAGLPEGPILDGAALDAGITGNNNFITDAATAFADVLVPAEQRSSLITLDIAPTTANEDETNNLVYTFSRTGSTTNALTVNYSVAGTGTFGTDYTQTGAASFADTTGTITFAAGAATATVTIDPTADTTFEANETVALSLASGTGYVIGATPAVIGTIVNDDSPTINLSADRTVVEGTTSPQTVSYTLTLSDRSTKTITVQYATANGTATAGLDYTSVTGTLTFNPGVTSQVINIPILNDSINEADETFTLNLSSPTNVNLGTATTVTTITDTLTASVTTTLANVENLTLTGTSAINGTGNVGNNILTGNTASNSLSGGAGNDTIIGGGGDDTIIGGTGNDSLIGGVGNNTYSFPATTALGSDTITEVEAGGIDTIDFTGTTVAVNVNLSATTAQRVNSNLNLSLSANNVIENATGGTGSDRITGNTLNNTLNGGDGNDQLQGLGGDDILWGRAGNDILSGGSGNDQYLFQGTGSFTTGLGVDYINEFVTGQDQILLSQATFNAITNVVGQPFTDFAVVADDESVDASNARIVYSQNTGSLFYNQNGNVLGATGVFVFASLGNPDITLAPNDFSLVV